MTITVHTINIASVLQPGNLIAWLIMGLIAGFLANVIVRGRSGGCIGNIIVGLIGAFIGGFLATAFEIGPYPLGFCGSLFISFVGAAIFLFILQLFTGGRS
ncbi:MAG: GlsB/YeaQ/YmgE family stress response membrane protein [Ktedonobacteraceae bacterium]|nr:GlsB/YeaQ/YmgE family stress response membrane protein [Ktedonobacteraceae bacterium]